MHFSSSLKASAVALQPIEEKKTFPQNQKNKKTEFVNFRPAFSPAANNGLADYLSEHSSFSSPDLTTGIKTGEKQNAAWQNRNKNTSKMHKYANKDSLGFEENKSYLN